MDLKNLAEMFAILTILEPNSKLCQFTARLATAGSATKSETDTAVNKEIKANIAQNEAELKTINSKKLSSKEALMVRILTPDA